MAIRIQLSSNFQVIELTYDDLKSVKHDEVNAATELINRLGKEVINEIKVGKSAKGEHKPAKKASERQIEYAVSLGLDEDEARCMSSNEISAYITKHRKD